VSTKTLVCTVDPGRTLVSTRAPQDPQNNASDAIAEPHFAQGIATRPSLLIDAISAIERSSAAPTGRGMRHRLEQDVIRCWLAHGACGRSLHQPN
jgi:hypothetical protein